ADMVGHSGRIEPTVRAVETVDACLARIHAALRARRGAMILTADHGNAEMMIDPETGGPHTAHTTNPVPLAVVGENGRGFALRADGALQDIAPTVLGLLGIPQPADMTGKDLRVPADKAPRR
ncbi:MAG: 2,3-bisphosphoglycerate-independent phosphoglycerate mutase, partial [Terriglobales bacterium]